MYDSLLICNTNSLIYYIYYVIYYLRRVTLATGPVVRESVSVSLFAAASWTVTSLCSRSRSSRRERQRSRALPTTLFPGGKQSVNQTNKKQLRRQSHHDRLINQLLLRAFYCFFLVFSFHLNIPSFLSFLCYVLLPFFTLLPCQFRNFFVWREDLKNRGMCGRSVLAVHYHFKVDQ